MSQYDPPFTIPLKFGLGKAGLGQTPVRMEYLISLDKFKWEENPQGWLQAAEAIVTNSQSRIAQFIQTAKRDVALSGNPIFDEYLHAPPQLEAHYQNQFGREWCQVMVSPQTPEPPVGTPTNPYPCIVFQNDGVTYYSTDAKKWKVDVSLYNYTVGAGGFLRRGCASYDVTTKTYLAMTGAGNGIASTCVSSKDGKKWSVAGGYLGWGQFKAGDVEEGPVICYEWTGLIGPITGGAAWSVNGGKKWTTGGTSTSAPDPPVNLPVGPIYPTPSITLPDKNTYVVQSSNLVDFKHNVTIPISAPGAVISAAAGNGVLVAIYEPDDPPLPGSGDDVGSLSVVGVSKDNVSWTNLTSIGDLTNYIVNPDGVPVGDAVPFIDEIVGAQLLYVPSFNKFVLASNQQQWFPIDVGGTILHQKGVLPLQIYTSSNGIKWTRVFQAGYTTFESAPHPVTTPAMTVYYYVVLGLGLYNNEGYGLQEVPFTDLIANNGKPVGPPVGWSFDLTATPPTVTLSAKIYPPGAAGTYQLIYNPIIYNYASPVNVPAVAQVQGGAGIACGIVTRYTQSPKP